MRRRAAAVALLVAAAGCGVRAQDEPDVLRSPPPAPTATPTSTGQPARTTPPPAPTGGRPTG